MPIEGDGHNCGLDLMMLCEAFICGVVPMHDSEILESMHKNGHLISSLATGILLLEECSLCPIELADLGHMDTQTTQREVFCKISEQFHYFEAHHRCLKGFPFACRVMEPHPFESIFFTQ